MAVGKVTLNQTSLNGYVPYAGGIAGYNIGNIYDVIVNAKVYSYGMKKVNVGDGSMGMSGIVFVENAKGGTIKNCILMGSSNGNDYSGGVAGKCAGTIDNCYCDEYVVITNNTNTVATQLDVGNINNNYFFTSTLGWDENYWDLSNVLINNGLYPRPIQK